MNTTTKPPRISKRAAASLLIAMLGTTALFGGHDSILNSVELLMLVWPLLMIALASYWLRVFLAEHAELHFDPELKGHSHLSGSGLYMLPFLFARS
jgi:hypothetical protein